MEEGEDDMIGDDEEEREDSLDDSEARENMAEMMREGLFDDYAVEGSSSDDEYDDEEDSEDEDDSDMESGEDEQDSSLNDSFEEKYGEPRIEVLEEKPLESTLPPKSNSKQSKNKES